MNRQNLLESIANTISDYRLGEIPPMTTSHVDRWVSQFDDDEQLIILSEMDHLLSKYYISKSKAESFLTEILTSQEFFGQNPSALLQNCAFLDIQKEGNSQKDLLTLANEITLREYGIGINQSCLPLLYVYLDDCLFSGNRAFRDMQNWVSNYISNTNNPCYVYLIFLGRHTYAIRYLENKLIPEAKQKNIHIKIKRSYITFNNLPWDKEKYECFWPVEITNDELVNKFVDIVKEKAVEKSVVERLRLFRPDGVPRQETLFSTPEARNIIESAFLRKGAYIASLPKDRGLNMRPMGYESLESLGFGSVFITYRNIANNCPLVLWWGDTNYHHSHPFSKWYPLFPRKGNESSGTTNN